MINFLFGLTVGFLVGVAATIYFAFHAMILLMVKKDAKDNALTN